MGTYTSTATSLERKTINLKYNEVNKDNQDNEVNKDNQDNEINKDNKDKDNNDNENKDNENKRKLEEEKKTSLGINIGASKTVYSIF